MQKGHPALEGKSERTGEGGGRGRAANPPAVSGENIQDMTLEELQDNGDEFSEEDERAIEMYRQQRLAEWKATQLKNKFGEVLEISGKDYVQEVTKAGEGLLVLHLHKQGIPLCALINQHLSGLARKFPDVKFVKAISTTCIPNYPDRNLPTVFVYLEGDIKAQLIGPLVFGGMNLTRDGKRSCRQARVCVCVCWGVFCWRACLRLTCLGGTGSSPC